MKGIHLIERDIQKYIFIFLTISSFLWIILTGLSIYYYPGGSIGDSTTEGFSFFYNAISDLGRFTAQNGESNSLSRALSIIAINLICISIALYFSVIWRFFRKKKVTKWLSIFGSISGVICSISYFALAYAATDTIYPIHKKLLTIFPVFFFISVILYIIVFFKEKEFPKINAYSFVALMLAAVALAITVIIGFVQGGELDKIGRRAGNTLFNFIQIFVYGLQGIGAYLYIKRQSKREIVG
ncbi:MAG: hypothetical protein GPJ51_06690 [Candidatus Heimdallarchaeota archaeon]|nr:hypothetical protein [Candidatus Heimdallarchaeota archaeon]